MAFYNFGLLNLYIALAITTTKATVIVLYFMHVKYSPRLIWVFTIAGLFWLVILFALMFGDYLTRF